MSLKALVTTLMACYNAGMKRSTWVLGSVVLVFVLVSVLIAGTLLERNQYKYALPITGRTTSYVFSLMNHEVLKGKLEIESGEAIVLVLNNVDRTERFVDSGRVTSTYKFSVLCDYSGTTYLCAVIADPALFEGTLWVNRPYFVVK